MGWLQAWCGIEVMGGGWWGWEGCCGRARWGGHGVVAGAGSRQQGMGLPLVGEPHGRIEMK